MSQDKKEKRSTATSIPCTTSRGIKGGVRGSASPRGQPRDSGERRQTRSGKRLKEKKKLSF